MDSSVAAAEIVRTLIAVDVFQLALIVIGTWLLIILSSRSLAWLAKRLAGRFRFYTLSAIPILRLLIILAGLILFITSVIEPTVENLTILLGLLGFGLGFVFKDYVSSLLAGIVTLYEAPYRPGDWIEINGAYGEVRTINMRNAEIVTPDDTVVFIPHLKIWDQLIFNANDGSQDLQCAADFYLHPSHDAAQIKQVLHDVALTSSFVQIEKPINVIVQEKPWGTHYRLKAYPVEPLQQFHFITDLTIRGKAAIRNRGVQFTAAVSLAQRDS